MIRAVLLIVAAILIVGWIGGQSVRDCIEAGNSPETCYATMNP